MPKKGSKRVENDDGTVSYVMPDDTEEANVPEEGVDVTETTEEEEPSYNLTESQIQHLINQAVDRAVADKVPAAGQSQRLRNADLVAQVEAPHRQTQEDVTLLGTTLGPVSHGSAFLPHPPEMAVTADIEDNADLIKPLEAAGYIVRILHTEFRAEWSPTRENILADNSRVRVPDDRPEPEDDDTRALLAQLDARVPTRSTEYVKRWLDRKMITGGHNLDEAVAREHSALSAVESGDLSGIDNLGIAPGADGAKVEAITNVGI